MSHCWLIITFSCFGTASLQYLNSGPENVFNQDPFSQYLPLPYTTFLHQQPVPSNLQSYDPENVLSDDKTAPELEQPPDILRYRRTADVSGDKWLPNLVDTDKTFYYQGDMRKLITDSLVDKKLKQEENKTEQPESETMAPINKRNFSPWGGKRSSGTYSSPMDYTWSWRRGINSKEPMMPKRVRFSPWGGKRSGQVIYRPNGSKRSKIIYSTNMPELTRVITNYYPGEEKYNFAGFQFIPSVDKRHPIKILSISSKMNDPDSKNAVTIKEFAAFLPKLFKIGHPYIEFNMKKDGKRKVKFSAWGGKRSPPIIGPIWTPAPGNFPESLLNAILVIKNPVNSIKDDQRLPNVV